MYMCVCENGVRVYTFEEHIHVMCEWVPMFYMYKVHFTTEASTTVPSCVRYSRR
jgi:hypothetical protein